MKDFLEILGIILFALVSVFLLIEVITYPFELLSCSAKAVSLPHYYNIWSGCMVQYEDMWLPIKNLIFIVK